MLQLIDSARLMRTFKKKIKNFPMVNGAIERIKNKAYFGKLDIHERMLADKVRVDAYRLAIKKYIDSQKTVIDLGTGTGILSFFAAQQQAAAIYAIEHNKHIIELAKYIAAQNSMPQISFVNMHSTAFTPPEKVDIILHEQMGSELFNEYMIKNICDLRDRVLKPGGKILPGMFELFLEPISLKEEYAMPFLWEQEFEGIKWNGIKEFVEQHPVLESSVHRRILPSEVDCFLCNPEPVFSFDLHSFRPEVISYNWTQKKKVSNGGYMDGFCLYFRTLFDDEITFDNCPFSRRTSWNCHFIRTPRNYFNEGDELDIQWTVKDISNAHTWQVSVK